MNILLIEDAAGFAKPIAAELSLLGHTVAWIVGVFEQQPTRVTGILADPHAQLLQESWNGDASRLVTLTLSDVDLALVDGGLVGPIDSGEAIIPHLVANDIICVAISGGGAGNTVLLNAGAQMGLPKEFVVVALRKGVLNPTNALKRPKATAGRLVTFAATMRAKIVRARARGRRVVLGFPVLDTQLK